MNNTNSKWMNLYYLIGTQLINVRHDHMEKDFQSTLVEPVVRDPELRLSSSSITIPVAFFT